MGDSQAFLPPRIGFQSLRSEIPADSWHLAEETTDSLLLRVQPTAESDERRTSIINYVMSLMRGKLNIEVLPFGSVPLKTYLFDGDIDLTALSRQDSVADISDAIYSILKSEEHKHGEFLVKNVRIINAEVKLVKCLIQGVAVDISFNQIGGLCTLCFLELINSYIRRHCLFKRSILLVKAWCYYEGRILGAHHGLISTYALEILVMNIFHLFHLSIDGPFSVLYKFLDYYSKFDWTNYCITVCGSASVSSQSERVAEGSEIGLFSQHDFKYTVHMFSAAINMNENKTNLFTTRYMNILDPLKESNNLGRSIGEGNLYRIQSALKYGHKKLAQILSMPLDQIRQEVHGFFATIIERHPTVERPNFNGDLSACYLQADEAEGREIPLDYSIFVGDYNLHHQRLLYALDVLESSSIVSSTFLQENTMHTHPSASSVGPVLRSYSSPGFFPTTSPYVSGWEVRRSRGTGTYIPQMSYSTYKERMKSRSLRSERTEHQNTNTNFSHRGGYEQNSQ